MVHASPPRLFTFRVGDAELSHEHAMNANQILGKIIFALMIVVAIASCAPATESPRASATRFTTPVAQRPAQSANPTPAVTPTPTVSRTPTLGTITLPTPPANGVSLALTPDTDQTGWVGSKTEEFSPDNNLNAGVLKGQLYASVLQFDVSGLAPGSKILFAALELSGRNGNQVGTQGWWTLDVLDTKKSNWQDATFDSVRRIPTLFTLGNPLPPNELVAGARKRFVLSASQLVALQKQMDVGSITIRLNGPTEGDNNLFVWEASPGVREPTLYLVVVPAAFTVITSVPTPPDVFAAATRSVGQTLQAQRIGTLTPLPRLMITATPAPFVVYTPVPTAVNRAEATATAAFITAVAFTTGTWTPIPSNWRTATPPPVAIPYASLTPVPTATPTFAPVAPSELAKRSLPAGLFNKIAFLSGSRSDPVALIMDPDGTHLAQLSDRTIYDIAAAREKISPDGVWELYNAPDKSARQILQIWRINLKSPSTPPEQITFHTRGISYAPVWSLDGSKILYTSTKDGREQEIFLFDLNDPHRWTRLSYSREQYLWNQYPTWSPDAKQIAFSSDRGHLSEYTEIWVMNADGSGAKKLGDGSRDAWAPVWIKWSK